MHPHLAVSLNDLASLYTVQGAYAKAEPLYVRALGIREKALGPIHTDVAQSLNNLASFYHVQEAYGQAEPLYIRALGIDEKALGPMHPDVALGLNNLGYLYHDQGAYAKAEPLLVRALGIMEKTLGPIHPLLAKNVNNLADLYSAQGNHERALPLKTRAAEIREEGLRIELARLSEPRKRALIKLLARETDMLVSLHATQIPGSRHALELALTTVLQRKGRILDSLVEHEATLRAHLTPPLRAQLDQLAQARTELVARLYPRTGSRRVLELSAIAEARARVEELESALTAVSAEFRAQSELASVAKVQAALPRGAALVEFVRYHRFDPRQSRKKRWQEERYVAYLLTSQGPPQWVALGAAAAIDAEVEAVLAAMGRNVAPEIAKAALRRLDALAFAPVRVRLTNMSHLIVAPDSKLNLVPFEALVDSQGGAVRAGAVPGQLRDHGP